jgi:nucleoid DNA-binding protein
MFYSQRSRRLLLNASKHWNTKKDLFTLLKQVLDDKYLKTASRESDDYKMFSDNTFTMILDLLYKENKYAFPYNPKTISGGFNSEYYIGKLYKLLNVDYKMFDYNVSDDHLFYSYLNEEFNSMEYRIVRKNIRTLVHDDRRFTYVDKDMVAPQVLMVIAHDNKKFTNFYKYFFPYTVINGSDTKKNLTSLSEKIYYRGVEYNLDSVILSNWNKRKTGHAIAGITCKKNKYVYNGWTRSSMDPMMARTVITRNIPCELMKYEWNIKKHNDFCLNTRTCFPDILKTKKDAKKVDLCFNFSKGRRILVYIRKETAVNTSNENEKDTKIIHRSKSPIKPKIIHRSKSPIKPKTAKAKAVVKKSCPEGKVRNPETGRCILIKNAKIAKAKIVVKKSCPEGKVRNPETGRCILIKNAKVAKAKAVVKKSCPEGKVRNPETGRCILIKNAKVAKAKAVVKK